MPCDLVCRGLICFGFPILMRIIGARVCCHDPGSGDDRYGLRQHLLDGVQRGFLRGRRPLHGFERDEAEEAGR